MSSVFRRVSLERLSSPEQLDTAMQVTNLQSWLIYLALTALLSVAVYWGVAGRIPIQVSAPTIILNSGGIKNLVATQSGLITQIMVEPGDVVNANEVIAEVMPSGEAEKVFVHSLYNGRILELKTDVGSLILSGQPIVSMEFVGEEIGQEAMIYLSPEQSRTIEIGMPVKIIPRTGSPAILTGQVVAISDFPVSHEAILLTLGSEELAQSIVTTELPIQVQVSINPAETAFIKTGTLANATVLIGTQRPIDLVIPLQ